MAQDRPVLPNETLPDFMVLGTMIDIFDSILIFFFIWQIIYFSNFAFLS